MNCMKCSRETVEDQVFCNRCLDEMEKYPVRPGTVILLPRRREDAARKAVVRKKAPPSPEEQVKALKKQTRRLIATILVLLALLGVSGYFAVVHLLETETVFLPGQNYSSITNTEAPQVE